MAPRSRPIWPSRRARQGAAGSFPAKGRCIRQAIRRQPASSFIFSPGFQAQANHARPGLTGQSPMFHVATNLPQGCQAPGKRFQRESGWLRSSLQLVPARLRAGQCRAERDRLEEKLYKHLGAELRPITSHCISRGSAAERSASAMPAASNPSSSAQRLMRLARDS